MKVVVDSVVRDVAVVVAHGLERKIVVNEVDGAGAWWPMHGYDTCIGHDTYPIC